MKCKTCSGEGTIMVKGLPGDAWPEDCPECKDYDPTPWCSYGHKTAKECDCGPIAENE